jgi:hypothetical protein
MRKELQDWQSVYAAGIKACPALKNCETYIIHKWLKEYSVETIVSAIQTVGRRGKPIPHWDYLTKAVEESAVKGEAEASVNAPVVPITDEAKANHIRFMIQRGIRMPHEERWLTRYEASEVRA